MKLTKVHLFIVLLLALVLCSFFGGSCASGAGLEGFNMPSDSKPYKGKGQYSDKYSSYGDLYKANDKFSKQQDKAYDRKDKPLPPSTADDDNMSKYASYDSAGADSGAGAGADDTGSMTSSGGSSQGIPASQIIPGQEDLYMLKSEIVPPVCPACPAMKCNASGGGGGNSNKCPPCPPCARCPEPAFECKKVPNYSSGNDDVLPRPVLNSFSQFGL
jgi:hypothetical protein